MGLVTGDVRIKAAIEVLCYLTFYRGSHGSGNIMGLVTGDVRIKAAIEVLCCLTFYCGGHGSGDIMGLVTGDVRIKTAFIVFNLLAADFFGGGAGGFYFVGTVHALGEGDFLTCAVIGFAHNAVGEVFGDGEGFGTISYSNLSFSCILADGGGLGAVHCFVFHGEGAVAIADHVSGDVLVGGAGNCIIAQVLADFFGPYVRFAGGVYSPLIGSGGNGAAVFIENGFCSVFHSANGFIDFGCYIAFINIGLVECFVSQGNMVRFQSIGDFQIFGGEFFIDYYIISGNGAGSGDVYRVGEAAAGKGGCAIADTGALYFTAGGYHITAGGNISGGSNRSHSGKGAAFHAGSTVGDSLAGDRTGSGDVFAGNVFAGNIAISMQIARCGNIFTRNIAGAGIDTATAGQDFTAIGIYAAIGCDFAVCINRKLSSRPFDGTVSIESRFSSIRRIAAGKYAFRCNDGTVLAHFDAIFAEGNLVVLAFVQDHFCDVNPLGSYFAIIIDDGGILLEDIFIVQGDAAVHSFHQFRISTDAGSRFIIQGLIGPFLGIYFHGRCRPHDRCRCRLYRHRVCCPGEVWSHKGCCHQQSCRQFLQSSPC